MDLTHGHFAALCSISISEALRSALYQRWQMRRSLCLYAVFLLAGFSSSAIAQARQQGRGRSGQDTLPANVVKGAMDAYKRKDVDAAYAFYDTVFTHQYLADTSGAKRIRRDDWVRQFKSDTGSVRALNTWRIVLLYREV